MSEDAISPERRRQFDRTFPHMLDLLMSVTKQWGGQDQEEMDRDIIVAYTTVWENDEEYDVWIPSLHNDAGERFNSQAEAQHRFGLVIGDHVINGSGIQSLQAFEDQIIMQAQWQYRDLMKKVPGLHVKIMRAPYISSCANKDLEELIGHLRLLISQASAEDLDKTTKSASGTTSCSRL